VNGGTQFAIQDVILNKQVMIMYLNKYCCGKFSKDFPTCTKLIRTHRPIDHNKHKDLTWKPNGGKITEREKFYFILKELQAEKSECSAWL